MDIWNVEGLLLRKFILPTFQLVLLRAMDLSLLFWQGFRFHKLASSPWGGIDHLFEILARYVSVFPIEVVQRVLVAAVFMWYTSNVKGQEWNNFVLPCVRHYIIYMYSDNTIPCIKALSNERVSIGKKKTRLCAIPVHALRKLSQQKDSSHKIIIVLLLQYPERRYCYSHNYNFCVCCLFCTK